MIFQDYLRASWSTATQSVFTRVNVGSATAIDLPNPFAIYDHIEDSDESIGSISQMGVTTFN